MKSLSRILIRVALVWNLLLVPPLVRGQEGAQGAAPEASDLQTAGEDVLIRAVYLEKNGHLDKLRERAEIHYRDWVLYADEVTFDEDTSLAEAEGHVVLDGGTNDEHVTATHATYNLKTEAGKFVNVTGTTGFKLHGRRIALISPTPFAFTGKLVEKLGPGRYVVHQGTVTSCEMPHPNWEFSAGRVTVEVGRYATLYNSTFRIVGVPVIYLPFATHPVQREPRLSGFMVPNIGHSSRKGTVLGESFYWAINRSMDATVGAEFYSQRGWAQHGKFRARPSETSYLDLTYFGVLDRGIGDPSMKQGGEDVHLNAEALLPHSVRGVVSGEYLSSYVFRLAFDEVFTQIVNSEVKSTAFLTHNANGVSLNLLAERYQNFQSTLGGDVVTILHAPSFQFSIVERRVVRTPLQWSVEAAAEGLSRSEPTFRTGKLLGRFDVAPRVALPLQWKGWSFRPELALRDTLYTQSLAPSSSTTGVANDDPLNRPSLEGSFELRPPAMERVYGKKVLGTKLKHVIEPRITYRYVTGVHDFSEVLRFDSRDILSNTQEVEYAIVNRLYARHRKPETADCGDEGIPTAAGPIVGKMRSTRAPWQEDTRCPKAPTVREVVRWELAQKYFLDPGFGGALVDGRRNVLTTTAGLTGIAFLTEPRHLSPLISRLSVQTSTRSEAQWDLDYDFRRGHINSSSAYLSYHFGQISIGGGDNYVQVPGEVLLSNPLPSPPTFHQVRALLGYGNLKKPGFSAASNFGFDLNRGFLQYGAIQTAYNWRCCGVSIEYRRFALGSVRNENQFRFAFNLANIGTAGNLRRSERLF